MAAGDATIRDARLFQEEDRRLREAKRWRELLDLYEARAAVLDDAGKERTYYKAGEVATDELADRDAAARLFLRSFQVRRSFLPAIGALKVLYQNGDDAAGLLEVLGYELEVTKDPRRQAQLHLETAELHLKRGDELGALTGFAAAIQAYPKSRQPLDALERLARKHDRWPELVTAYQTLAGAAKEKQAAVYQFLGGTVLDEQLVDPEGAARAFRASLEAGPRDPRILSAIEKFFERTEDWDGLTKALWQHIDVAEDARERVRLLKKQAELYETRLREPARAQKLLLKALEEVPQDAAAVKALIAVSKTLDDPRGLARAYELEAQLPGAKKPEQAESLERAAEQRHRAGEGRKAYSAIRKALALRPRSARGLKLMERITHRLGEWEEHARTLERERELLDPTRSETERKATLAILLRLADVAEKRLKDDARAQGALRALVALDPANVAAWERLAGAARRRGDWAAVAEVLDERIAAAARDGAPEAAVRELWRELGEVRRGGLRDRRGAARAYEALLELDPADAGALEALAGIHREAGDLAALAQVLERRAQHGAPPERATALRDLARLALERKRFEEARQACRDALDHEGEGPGALEAWELLVRAADALGDDELMREALGGVKRYELDPDRLRWARIQLAKLDDRAGKTDEALLVLHEALAEAPADEEALPLAIALLEGQGRYDDAALRLEAASQALEHDPARAAGVCRQLARLCEDRLSAPERALDAWQRALRAAPDHAEAFARVVALARAAGRFAELRALLEDVTPSVDEDGLRRRMLRERAVLSERELGDPEAAVAAYERLLDEDPHDPDGVAALRRLYRQLERWGELAGLLERAAGRDGAPPAEAGALLREAAEVAEQRLRDLPRAARALEEVLAGVRDAADPAWEALVHLYARLERHEDRVRALERVAGLETEPARRAERLAAAAQVLEERVGAYERAIDLLGRALEAAPRNPGHLAALARVQRAAGRHDEATRTLATAAEVAEATGDRAGAAAVLLERGRLLEERLTDPEAAEAAYREALARDPGLVAAHEALIASLERRGRWAPLQEALAAAAEALAGEERAALLVRRGEVLAGRLAKVDEALAAFDAAEAARPALALCLEARVRVLRRARRPEALADALARRRAAEPNDLDTSHLIRLLREEAEVRAFALRQPEPARALLLDALKRRSKDGHTLKALVRVERLLGLGEPLAEHLEAAARLERDRPRQAALLAEAGVVLRTRGGDPQRARDLFNRALKADPTRLEAVRWLARIAREERDLVGQVEWTAEEARLEPDPARRAALLTRLGRLQAEREPAAAREALERALKEVPGYLPALRRLAPLLRTLGDTAALAQTLERLAEAEPDRRTRVDLWVALGEVRLAVQREPRAARAAYDRALAEEPGARRALAGRAETFDAKQEPAALADALRALAAATPEAAERGALAKRLAALLAERLEDLDGARAVLEELLALDPHDAQAWKQIREVCMEQRDFARLAELYAREARQLADPRAQEERFRQAAQIRQHHLGDKAGAAALYREVLLRGDPHALAVEVLPKLYRELGDEEGYERALREVPRVIPRTAVAARALLELAERGAASGRRAAAVQDCEAALEHDPRLVAALDLLAELHREAGEPGLRVEALLRKRELLGESPAAAELSLEAARVVEDELRDAPRAIELLQEALRAISEEHPERRREVVDWLARLCRRTERHRELADALAELAARTPDPASAAALLLERAEVQRDRLGDARAAVESLEEAFSRHRDLAPLDPLVELLEREELWDELVRALEARAELSAEGEAKAAALARAAEVLDARLGRPDDAVHAWERVQGLVPDRAEAYAAAEAICRRIDDRRALARVLEREARRLAERAEAGEADAAERVVGRALEAARLLEAAGEVARALEALERARRAAPLDRAVFDELDRLYGERGEAPERYRVLADRAERVEDAEERLVLHERLARLAAEALGEPERARGHWEQVLEGRPGHPAAVAALEAHYRARGAFEDVVRVLRVDLAARERRRAAGEALDAGELAARHLELGEVLERELARAEEAIASYRAAAREAKDDPRPLRGLERLHEAAEAWDELVADRRALRAQSADRALRAELSLAIAAAHERRRAPDEALTALREARAELPDDPRVLARLRVALLEAERFEEAAEVLAREAETATAAGVQLARRMERAVLLRDRLGAPQEAIAELERARALAPGDPAPLDALAPLYEQAGERAKWIEALEARAALEEDDAAAATLHARAGELGAEGSPASAAESYERALRRDPARTPLLDALIALYERLERWRELARALHRRAARAAEAGEPSASWLRRAAEVEERRLSAPAQAAATFASLLASAPEDDAALAELARLRGALGEHAAQAEALARRAALARGDARRALLLERAELLADRLARPAAAAAALEAALETLAAREAPDPEVRALAGRRADLCEAAGDLAGVLEATRRALPHRADAADERALLARIGELASGPVYRPAAAIEAYGRLRALQPDHEPWTAALAALLEREGRAAELAALLAEEEARLAGVPGAREALARARLRRAELLQGELERPEDAVACYRAVLAEAPEHEPAREALERLLRRLGRASELADLLGERAARAAGPGPSAEALLEEAAVREEAGELARALERLEQARERASEDGVAPALRVRVLRALVRLYRREARHEELARTLAALADEEALSAAERAAVAADLGAVLAGPLGREDEAAHAFEGALALDPESVLAARGLAAILRARGDDRALVRVYEGEARAGVDRRRLIWLHDELGALRARLGELEQAQAAYETALELDARDLVALRGLVDVCRRRDDFHRLASALEALAGLTPSSLDRQEARRELARLCEEALRDPARAARCYRQVLEEAPRDRDALRGLARQLRALEDTAGLAPTLEAELELAEREDERRLLALEAGRAREALAAAAPAERAAHLERALAHGQLACELAPADADALGFTAGVAEQLGRWQLLADLTCRLAETVDDPARAGWMLRRAAQVRSLRLGDARGAADALLAATRLEPSDREAWQALEPLAASLEDRALLREVLERRLPLARDESERVQLALALGQLLLELEQLPEAIAAFTLARDKARGPARQQTLALLEAACRQAGRWAELAEVLEARTAAPPLPPNARELRYERAAVLEQRLARADRAVEVLEGLRREQPDDARAVRDLERLLATLGRWTDLVELYEVEAQRRGRGGYEALVLMGRVARERLDDPELAASALQRAVTLNPAGLDALDALKELYTATERWAKLLDTLRLEIGLLKDPGLKERRLRQAAQLAEERLGDLVTAARFYGEAASLAPRDRGLLEALARVQAARGEHAGRVETLGRLLALAKGREDTTRLLLERGRVLADCLAQPTAAIEAFGRVLEIAPDHEEALVRLGELYRSQAAWRELAATLERRMARARGQRERLALSLELARIEAERLRRAEPAVRAAEQALAQDPRCVEAARLVVDVLERFGDPSRTALPQAQQRLAGMLEGSERAAALLALAATLGRLEQAEPALAALREAHRADPAHVEATDRLREALEAAGQWDEAIATCRAAAKATGGFRAAELLAHMGRLLDERKGDPAGAEKRFRAALELAPAHLPALRGLIRLLLARGAGAPEAEPRLAQEVVRRLIEAARLEPDPAQRAAARVQAGDVLRDALGLFGPALEQYERALQVAPQSVEALAGAAELHWAAGAYEAALPLLDRLASAPGLGADPERAAELLWARGCCAIALGLRDRAVASLRAALQYAPGHLQALEDLAALLVGDGAWQAARPVLEQLVERTRPPRARAEHALTLARVLRECGDRDGAAARYAEGLEVLPERADAHLALAELVREREPEAARRRLEWAAAVAGPERAELEAEARLALAELLEAVFQEADAAAAHLVAAAALNSPSRGLARRRLAEVHGRAGRWKDATRELVRALELEPDRKQRGELYSNLARVVRDRLGKPVLARRCFERALELEPGDKKTLDSLLRLLKAAGDGPSQVRALQLAADAARGGAADEVPLRLQLSEALLEQQDRERAAAELERVLAIEPTHSGARATLGELWLELGRVDGVERLHREVLARDPFEVASYQALRQGWAAARRKDAAGQAAQVLAALRALEGKELAEVQRRGQQAPRTKVQVSDEAFARRLVHEACSGPLLEVLRACGPTLMRQVPDDLKAHGIGWRSTRHGIEGSAFPEHALLKRVCDLLGITELDVYWMPDWKKPEPVLGHAKGVLALILCPEVFAGLSDAEKAFVLARAVAPARLSLDLFRAVPPATARLLLLGALKGLDAGRSFPGEDERGARAVTKAVARLPVTPALREAGSALWRRREALDWDAIVRGVQRTAVRCGVLVAGGAYPATQALCKTNLALRGRVPGSTPGAVKLLREVPEMEDLLPFAVSPGYLALREACLRTEL